MIALLVELLTGSALTTDITVSRPIAVVSSQDLSFLCVVNLEVKIDRVWTLDRFCSALHCSAMAALRIGLLYQN